MLLCWSLRTATVDTKEAYVRVGEGQLSGWQEGQDFLQIRWQGRFKLDVTLVGGKAKTEPVGMEEVPGVQFR